MSQISASLRRLGQHGPLIAPIGFGLMGMSMMYGQSPTDLERFAVLDRAAELGITYWDTSDAYGDSEELLGKWIKHTGNRARVFLATKFGVIKGAPDMSQVDSSAAYCRKACDESLKVLGTSYIDLYYMHRANPDTPIEETVRAMVKLKAEGKVKYIGLSEVSSATLRRACKVAHIDAIQVEYSPFVLDIEDASGTNLLATARELGVAVVAYSPLGRGILTGNFASKETISHQGDFRSLFPMYAENNIKKNTELVNQLKTVADEKGCTAAQLAIAWLLKQGGDVIPIPGTKRIKTLEENWSARNINMTDAEEAEVRKIIKEAGGVAGGRAPDWAMSTLYVDTREEGFSVK